jgi:hypothetical protein
MSPKTPGRGVAYVLSRPDAEVTIGAEPRDLAAVALDRLLGLKTDDLERVSEASVFSDRTQTRLASQLRNHLRSHREHPALRAESFMEI